MCLGVPLVGCHRDDVAAQEIHTSWATVRDLLATHEIATIVLPTDQDGVLWIRRGRHPSRTTGFCTRHLGYRHSHTSSKNLGEEPAEVTEKSTRPCFSSGSLPYSAEVGLDAYIDLRRKLGSPNFAKPET